MIIQRRKKWTKLIGESSTLILIFSSPEHKVLRVSNCNSAVSVVRHLSLTFWLVYALEAIFSVQLSRNMVRMFVLMKSGNSMKMGHVGSKTRSLGQILEKPYVCSRHHIFSTIVMKLGQNVLKISHTLLKMGHVRSKTGSLGQISEKPCQIFSLIILKLGQNVCLDEISAEFENGSCWVKN